MNTMIMNWNRWVGVCAEYNENDNGGGSPAEVTPEVQPTETPAVSPAYDLLTGDDKPAEGGESEEGEKPAEGGESEEGEKPAEGDKPKVSLEEYVVEGNFGLDENSLINPYVDKMRSVCYELGLDVDVFGKLGEALVAFDKQVEADVLASRQRAYETQVEGLQSEYGQGFSEAKGLAREGLRLLQAECGLSAAEMEFFQIPEVSGSPALFKMLGAVAKASRESGFKSGQAADAMAAKSEYESIMGDSSNPLRIAYMDSSHPDHRIASEKISKLYQEAFGG